MKFCKYNKYTEISSVEYTHTHTHTHTEEERGRERGRESGWEKKEEEDKVFAFLLANPNPQSLLSRASVVVL